MQRFEVSGAVRPLYGSLCFKQLRRKLIDLHWVRAFAVPMNPGLTDCPFVPHNLISAQDSPVPLPKSQTAPRLKILMSCGSK